MDQVEIKKGLVKRLDECEKSLDIERLYKLPSHRESKNWLADVLAILKNLDETDYQAFKKLKESLDIHILRSTRKPIVKEIDGFMREKVAAYKLYNFGDQQQSPSNQSKQPQQTSHYVSKVIISGFINKKDKFNYKKLLKLFKELNINFSKRSEYSSAMLIRAILDHIPPLLGFNTFDEVVNNYSWSKTDRQYMKTLFDFKNVADDSLHRTISEDEDLFEIDNIPNSKLINRLLQECLKKGEDPEFIKAKQSEPKKEIDSASKITITLVEEKCGSWQNYAVSRYMGYSFKFVLDIDNFKSQKLDYVSVLLKANSTSGPWKADHFVFDTDRSDLNKPYEIDAGKQEAVTVAISDQEFSHTTRDHRFKPNLDFSTLTLSVTTKSGKTFDFPIRESMLK